jgi:predicted O-methyltransferase YrrM
MRSSYRENNYGAVLSGLVIGKRPELCVELGVLDGYSTIHIATALKFNKEAFGIDGRLYCWDLWDTYEYKHGTQKDVQERLDHCKLAPIVKLMQGDAFEASQFIQESSIDFLHVDVSNDGVILKKVMDFWSHRMKPFGMIAFEGGSEERDNIEWMVEYNKRKIIKELESNEVIKENFHYFVMTAFPSMTILQKKGCFT